MRIKNLFKLSALLSMTLLLAGNSFGQYTQNATNVLAPGSNPVEKSATTNTLATFQNAVAVAWTNNSGGVLNFPTGIANPTTVFRGSYGTNAGRMQITSSVNMQNITTSGTSFTVASSPNGTTSSANQSDYTLTVGLFNTNSGLPLVNESIKQIGFVILSRGTTTGSGPYPLDLRVTVTFSDGSTQAVTSVIGYGSSADDTFFGFTAPPNLAISSVRLQSFVMGTENPVADRIGWDDFGFITGPTSVTPQPQIVNASPAAYAIVNATNGIHFQALTYVSVDPTNISLVLNSSNVSGSLIFTGDPTNYSVAYNGLVADQEYTMTINVTNSGGTATLSRTFYTATTFFTLFDSEGFTADPPYPLGPLQQVTHGRGTWFPNALEPAEIVDVGGDQGKVLQRMGTGASRIDVLTFPPVSSGRIIMEFDTKVSTTSGRTIDIALQPVGSGNLGSFLAWGEVSGKLAYFDNVSWLPIADLESDWHHVKIINYLSGVAAGKYDVFVNGSPVGQRLPWRNAAVGSAFNQFRIQSQNTSLLFETGQIDNLVITAAPEDPNTALPPQIIGLNITTNPIIPTSSSLEFVVASTIPIDATNVTVLLNSNDISGSLVLTGPSTNRTVTYGPLTNGNFVVQIQAQNSAGTTVLTPKQFIVSGEAWMTPGDGWVSPWQWTSGFPEQLGTTPVDGATPYLQLNTPAITQHNFMREYQSGTVDITKPHYIQWKFRVNDPDFDANFSVFNDRVHFFAHPVSRITASTTTGNSWAIMATGADNGTGANAGQTFWIYDNIDGTGAFSIQNSVDSHLVMRPDHIYSFQVLVSPASRTYSVVLVDETASVSFTSSAPHHFRDIDPLATHNFLHFGVQTSPSTDARSMDLDSVSVTQAALPVTLLNPNRSGSNFSFSFQSQIGASHVIQYKQVLGVAGWTDLQTIPGDGTLKMVTHTNPPSATLFYRVNSTLP